MKKSLAIIAAILMSVISSWADEGMWLPALISQRIGDMQAKGFKLSAEDVYSVNQASLKDAVVLFGGGCTGELISPEGLLLTNHHCGYSWIQKHSSVEHDYLKDGYWAMTREQELPDPGLTVSFLDHMEDVTAAVLDGYVPEMTEAQRDSLVREHSAALIKAATADGGGLTASVEPLFYGNQYFLFVFRVYRDVRFVGAPPSSIGKFGGDTDNWMWPRHTGDFSLFRVYAGPDGMPADYDEANVPYVPRKYFNISLAGVREGDFTFIYGCPGSTQEYVHSSAVRYISDVSDPHKIALRTGRLDIHKKYMDASQAVRIQYSSKYASISNAWKKWQGEAGGIRKMNTVETKRAFETRFEEWARGTGYAGLVGRLEELYARREPYYFAYEYYTETVRTIELLKFAASMPSAGSQENIVSSAESFFKDYYLPIDRECFVSVMSAFDANVPESFQPAFHKEMIARYGTVEAWADDLFSSSLFADEQKVLALTPDDVESMKDDPAYVMNKAYLDWYNETLRPVISEINSEIALANRDYMRGQMEMQADRSFYPDANLTLRVAYGHVEGYSPSDGVYYYPSSTLTGIIEKDDPDIFDYNIPQVLRDLYAEGGYEQTPVCFLATNHTSGGNSGSPVINAEGNLIGVNFDRVWEGTMSDIVFDPDYCRNISLDIRYFVFVVSKVGHADHLLDEMTFVYE